MPRDGSRTRTRILDEAQGLVLVHGFAGTSVDAIIERADTTKGAFFHHFPSKSHLAHALVSRYAEHDAGTLEETMKRAERLVTDPLQQLLVFVGLFAEDPGLAVEPDPGCLFASYCYGAQLLDEGTHEIVRRAVGRWRDCVAEKLREAAELHPPAEDVDLESVADLLFTLFEGAFVLARATGDPTVVAEQLQHYRSYLRLLFRRH